MFCMRNVWCRLVFCSTLVVLWQTAYAAHGEEKAAADTKGAAPERDQKPSPQLSPEDVIRLQIEELSAAGDVAGRIARCYRFASPENKKYTGPITRFSMMIKVPPYDALLDARRFLVGRAAIEGNQAHLLLTVVNDKNELAIFRCFLSKQTAVEFKDCWMTDAVLPVGGPKQPAVPARPPAESI
jgi:hypothetical protein